MVLYSYIYVAYLHGACSSVLRRSMIITSIRRSSGILVKLATP